MGFLIGHLYLSNQRAQIELSNQRTNVRAKSKLFYKNSKIDFNQITISPVHSKKGNNQNHISSKKVANHTKILHNREILVFYRK